MWIGTLILTLLLACQGTDSTATQNPEAQEPATPVVETQQSKTVEPIPTSGPIKPPAGWPVYNGVEWKFNPEREDPVPCRFTVKMNGANTSQVRLIGVYGEQNYPAGEAEVLPDGTAVFTKEGGFLGGFYYILFDTHNYLQLEHIPSKG